MQAEFEEHKLYSRQTELQLQDANDQLKDELAATLKKYEFENKQWNAERKDMMDQVLEWKSKQESAIELLNELRQQLTETGEQHRERITQLEDDIEQVYEQKEEQERLWKLKEKQLESEYTVLEETRRALESDIRDREDDIEKLMQQNSSDQSRIEEVTGELKALRENNSKLEEGLNQASHTIESLQELNTDLEDELVEAELDSVETVKYYIELLQEQYQSHYQEKDELKDKLKDSEQQLMIARMATNVREADSRYLREVIKSMSIELAESDRYNNLILSAHPELPPSPDNGDTDAIDSDLSEMVSRTMNIDSSSNMNDYLTFYQSIVDDMKLTHKSELEFCAISEKMETLRLTIMNKRIIDAAEEVQQDHQAKIIELEFKYAAEFEKKIPKRKEGNER